MSHSPQQIQQQQQQQQNGYAQPYPAATLYGVPITQQSQQMHQPVGGHETTYPQQYHPGPPTSTSAYPPPPAVYGLPQYHPGYPPSLPYPYALPTQVGYASHFYPAHQHIPHGGPLPNMYGYAPLQVYPPPVPVHSPLSKEARDDKITSSDHGNSEYDQYANKNSSSPLKHDPATTVENVSGGGGSGDKRPSPTRQNDNVIKERDIAPVLAKSSAKTTVGSTKPKNLHINTMLESNELIMEPRYQDVDDMVSRVKPMRSDFHFYAEDHKKDVMQGLQSATDWSKKDAVDVISELNERLLKKWEDETDDVRNFYLTKEELDKTRFMNEEEIGSRHCATLTSRPKGCGHLNLGDSKSTPKNEEDGGDGERSLSAGKENARSRITPKSKQRQGHLANRQMDGDEKEEYNDEEEEVEEEEDDDYESPNKKLRETDSEAGHKNAATNK